MAKSELSELKNILGKYQTDVNDALKSAIKETAKDGVKAMKTQKYAKLPSYVNRRQKGYSKGWTTSPSKKGKYKNSETIHNKTDYQLTHLLEEGHMKRNGTGRTRAFPHIQPTRDVLEKEVIKITEEKLEQI